MNKKIVIVIILFLILQFVKLWWVQEFKEEHGESRIEYLAYDGEGFDYERLVKNSVYQSVLPVALKQKRVNISKIDTATQAIGVTAQYIQLEHLDIVEGSFIVDQAVQEKRNVVVISEQVAIKLFRTTKIIGKTIDCNDQLYKVIGVYKERKHVWERICDDGYEVIYIPITDLIFKETGVQQVIINRQYIENMLNQAALDKLGLKGNTINAYDYSHWTVELRAISRLPIMIVGVIFCILLDKKVWNHSKWKEVLKQQKHEINRRVLLNIVVVNLFVIGINITVIYLCVSNFYINPNNLPAENIFDVSFYWKQLCDRWIKENLYRRECISTFGNLLITFKKIIYFINLIQCIGVAVILESIKTGKQ